jgi:heterodisulfide reductase subunit C
MNTNPPTTADNIEASTLTIRSKGDQWLKVVNHLARTNISLCWHCLSCSGGCPFGSSMDLMPNQVIRLVQMGEIQESMRCRTIWICVGCHTCSAQCPNGIDIAAVMDALRQLSIREGIVPGEKDIYRFHKYIYESIQRHGRLNKLEAMVQFKVGTGQLFTDLQLGMRMITRGKLEIIPHRIKERGELNKIFSHYHERRRSFKSHG